MIYSTCKCWPVFSPFAFRDTKLDRQPTMAAEAAPMRILAISGSMRPSSMNSGLLRACAKAAVDGVVEVEVYDISTLPLYNPDLDKEGTPAAVTAFKQKLVAADALLIATPEHNFSLSACLKSCLDWGSRACPPDGGNGWAGKPVGIMAVGGGGGIQSQMELRKVAVFLELFIMNRPFLSVSLQNDYAKFNMETGDVTDEGLIADAGAMVTELQRFHSTLAAGGELARFKL